MTAFYLFVVFFTLLLLLRSSNVSVFHLFELLPFCLSWASACCFKFDCAVLFHTTQKLFSIVLQKEVFGSTCRCWEESLLVVHFFSVFFFTVSFFFLRSNTLSCPLNANLINTHGHTHCSNSADNRVIISCQSCFGVWCVCCCSQCEQALIVCLLPYTCSPTTLWSVEEKMWALKNGLLRAAASAAAANEPFLSVMIGKLARWTLVLALSRN